MGTDKAVGLYIIVVLVVVLIASGGAGEFVIAAAAFLTIAGAVVLTINIVARFIRGD